MTRVQYTSLVKLSLPLQLFAIAAGLWNQSVLGQDVAAQPKPAAVAAVSDEAVFKERIAPLLQEFCVRCHNADQMKSGVRVDHLTAVPDEKQIKLWTAIQKQVADEAMPPDDEPLPTPEQRKTLDEWITRSINAARSRPTPRNGSVRRLTVMQYRNTLRDLLGLEDDLTGALPPDALSKDGFANNGQTLELSPLQVEAYFDIAEKALDLCIVDEQAKPVIQNFRMDLGASINKQPCPDTLILGALSMLLANQDFVVTELQPAKPFAYEPFRMRIKNEFIEGYAGNDTVRGWRKYDSIYHSVFACVRGTPGYPRGEPYSTVPQGLLLRPAIPSPEIFGVSNTYGPMANFKISLRELPDQGNFRVTVRAARYDDGLLLEPGARVVDAAEVAAATDADFLKSPQTAVTIKSEGIYQIDVTCAPGKPQGLLSLTLGERQFSGALAETSSASSGKDEPTPNKGTAFLLVRLPAGELPLAITYGDNARLRKVTFSRIADDSEPARRFNRFVQRSPELGVYLGLRRDCGSTLTMVGAPQSVANGEIQDYVFEGAIRDFPSPDVEKDNVNYLAGIREIGVRSEYTDGRDMPRLLIKSVEFEGPYYTSWPPATHRNIFVQSPRVNEPAVYARDVIRSFASRAFRRPATAAEQDAIFDVWQASYSANRDFRQSIKNALLVVLTSPQFLFVIEKSSGPESEDLDGYELASKLSYFLWNSAPDQQLLDLAASGTLHQSLDAQIDRMLHDRRFGRFANEFASQWLTLDKFDVVATDAKRYPRLTRDAKAQLRQEPIQFLRHLIENNLPLRNLIQSDFIVANEVTANYYSLGDRTESGFQFVPIKHENSTLGGVLTQAGILAGLSDGREANPVKRGAWVARKIVAEPPDDPPPNVPQIKDDDGTQLTLRQKLELHRNQKGCVKCHSGIDPWGLPFESFDAGGLLKQPLATDTESKLPDGTEVKDLNGLKAYLAGDRLDQVAFSFMKHLAAYATGRSLSYNEIAFLKEHGIQLKSGDYRMQDVLRFVIKSDLFLKK